jgi:hypothetical protein
MSITYDESEWPLLIVTMPAVAVSDEAFVASSRAARKWARCANRPEAHE